MCIYILERTCYRHPKSYVTKMKFNYSLQGGEALEDQEGVRFCEWLSSGNGTRHSQILKSFLCQSVFSHSDAKTKYCRLFVSVTILNVDVSTQKN